MAKVVERLELPKSDNYVGNVYFNGFAIGISNTDASIEITLSGEKVGRLIMPFAVLKNLGNGILKQVEFLEGAIGNIEPTKEVSKKIVEAINRKKSSEKG